MLARKCAQDSMLSTNSRKGIKFLFKEWAKGLLRNKFRRYNICKCCYGGAVREVLLVVHPVGPDLIPGIGIKFYHVKKS